MPFSGTTGVKAAWHPVMVFMYSILVIIILASLSKLGMDIPLPFTKYGVSTSLVEKLFDYGCKGEEGDQCKKSTNVWLFSTIALFVIIIVILIILFYNRYSSKQVLFDESVYKYLILFILILTFILQTPFLILSKTQLNMWPDIILFALGLILSLIFIIINYSYFLNI